MIEPQGPLPPEVYWRRRLLAVVAAVAVVAVVIGLIVWVSSGGSDSNPKNAAAKSSTAASPPPSQSADPSAPGDAGNSGPGAAPSSNTPAPPPANENPPAQNDAGNGVAPCSDQAISVVLYTDKPTYSKGDQPVFTIVTTNGGLAPCSRDVGKAAQNVVVRTLDGTRTLWSAQDCAPDKTVNDVVLQPGQQVNDNITWSGTTSSPGCTKPRVAIPVGGYQAIAKIGQRESAPITFNVVAPAEQ